MLNHVFIILIILGIVVGMGNSIDAALKADTFEQRIDALKLKGKEITDKIKDMVETAVKICLDYIGLMALWLGIMKIADESGLVSALVNLLRPIMIRLFPRVPANHPAMGAMLMNMAANMLGLDNAATPIGLKAMKELQTLNAEKDTASNAMIMFLAINTSSITLIPFSVMAFRATTGSQNPQIILGPALLATTCSTACGIAAAYLLAKFSKPTRDYYDEFLAGKDLNALAEAEASKES
ncbi:MAG TPA: nucleoside recognition domain-containing protein [Candidatus Sumerlaeota bacterium]|nr:MAG: Spore maturation protein A [candidate division BRC1 bacterium ADurb.Bin183]HOE63631.1 nucleoside recognition domain-containing protein [Candidatus Sumerlaeota bacterium]HRR30861.1 nucleoside recognition domain-containing protein [Candidatus Sumerlaeia bacterium]HON50527.1 nucleoside recognition domain-containing protein [Candidatus Sumerlaeota bacterium]HOR63742.1 nucleoside recognition domain-containing protein [Candidatus Sumerlaeota bacterium]